MVVALPLFDLLGRQAPEKALHTSYRPRKGSTFGLSRLQKAVNKRANFRNELAHVSRLCGACLQQAPNRGKILPATLGCTWDHRTGCFDAIAAAHLYFSISFRPAMSKTSQGRSQGDVDRPTRTRQTRKYQGSSIDL